MDLGLEGKVAVVTGGGGAICGAIASELVLEGASVAIWDLSFRAAERTAEEIAGASRGFKSNEGNRRAPGVARAVECDVLDADRVKGAAARTVELFGTVDLLVNGAGGSRMETTTSEDLSFFDMEPAAMERVLSLNYMSAVLPSREIGPIFAGKKSGAIVNISSVAGVRPLTRALSYCSGKAATNNFTQWLAVYMAQTYSPSIRVNAIAPGFVLTEQNRFLLTDPESGAMTERGRKILAHVPVGRLGTPREIAGAALWLLSERASFVTGSVVIVDGGFSAYSGV